VRILVELSDFNDGTNATKMSKFMYIYLGGIPSSSIQHSFSRSESFKKGKKPGLLHTYTVRRVDEVVQHQHLVTQDQFTQVSKKFSDIPAEDLL
jgi:hypothetical protein